MESLLNEIQLSEKIHVSLACLRRWRLRGEGPQYVKVGLRLYLKTEGLAGFGCCRSAGTVRCERRHSQAL
jgi:hypothetical protein